MKNTIKNRTLTIILLGLQGSGKGTQAQFLMDKYGFKGIDTGSLIRKAIQEDTIPTKDKLLSQKGKLVRVSTTVKLVKNKIEKLPKLSNLVIDGSPRSMGETYSLMKFFKELRRDENIYVVDLEISKKTVFDRVAHRFICKKCGRTSMPGQKHCHCGGKLEKRNDDNIDVLKNRLKFVSKDLDAIKAYFKKKNLLTVINGEQSPKIIFNELVKKVGL
ncbi:nucleoside monophosphate kinase [bacterium]|nr:nucleoside monophosphate kinase [bacterium]